MIKTAQSTTSTDGFYSSRFHDSVFVIKVGGQVISNPEALASIVGNCRTLLMNGIRVLMVYGGGAPIDRALEAHGITPRKVEGRRITTPEDMAVIKAVLAGDLGLRLHAALASAKVHGLCLNAVPSDWMDVVQRPSAPVDFGLVGDITEVRAKTVRALLDAVGFVAVPCMAADSVNGTTLNINADTVATELAMALEATKLVFLSDTDGVKVGGNSVSVLSDAQIPALLADGTASGGMKVKLETCLRALQSGVSRIHLLNGLHANALVEEIYTSGGSGTMLIREADRKVYENEVAYQKGRKPAV